LNELIYSLHCLDYGAVDPPLQPPKLTHRPSDPRWALFRGYAAAASALLIRHGATASAADSWVAKRLSKEGYERPGISGDTRITAATIKGWRKEARERRPGDLLRAAFNTVLEGELPRWDQEYLTLLPAAFPEILFDCGIEERVANVGYSEMLHCLSVIDMILVQCPPYRSTEK
jgi:hypothetical protein